MKILSIEERENKIVVTTDNKSRSEFVYSIDRFKDLVSLEREIEKSIIFEFKRNLKKRFKFDKVKKEHKVKLDELELGRLDDLKWKMELKNA